MPLPQLACAIVEKSINQILSLDPKSDKRIQALNGKSIRLQLDELATPLVFVFSSDITVMSHNEEVDCELILSIATAMSLKDTHQITKLLKNDSLQLNGDIQVAQAFASLVQSLDIDWEEQLSKSLGDVASHNAFQFFTTVKERVATDVRWLRNVGKDAIINERPIAISQTQIDNFTLQVNQLRSDSARLEARIKQLLEVTE